MSDISPADPNVDLYGYLGIIRSPDGTITRLPGPATPASSDPRNPFHLSKDLPINQSNGTWARMFVPQEAFHSSPTTKLPVIVYFHGGGFIVGNVSAPLFNDLHTELTIEIPAVIISVDYRLAPEHRLPAAYNDCLEALYVIKDSNDEWLEKYADLSKCFLMGTSAGGNIAYHGGLHAAARVDDLKPLEIKGLILHHPFFGGTKRTNAELRMANDKVIPLCATDFMWELSLPIGADRDHEFSNPMMGINPQLFELIKALGWKILVIGCAGDPLIDRQIELAKKLEENGVSVQAKFDDGGYHGYGYVNPTAKAITVVVKEFVLSSINC